jgi:hypothetical protein
LLAWKVRERQREWARVSENVTRRKRGRGRVQTCREGSCCHTLEIMGVKHSPQITQSAKSIELLAYTISANQ